MVVIYAKFEWFWTPYASCITSGHLSSKTLEKCKNCWKLRKNWHGALNWSYNTKKKIGAIVEVLRNKVLPNGPFSRTMNTVNFLTCRKWPHFLQASEIAHGIHDRFERILTPYASCITSDHLLTIFQQKNSRKWKNSRKLKKLGMVPWIVMQGH